MSKSETLDGQLPGYNKAIQTVASRFYFNNIPKGVSSVRSLNISHCPIIDGQPSSEAVEKKFHVAFVNEGFSVHRGQDDTAPVVATAKFRKKHPIGTDIWMPNGQNMRICATDLEIAKGKKLSEEEQRLPVLGSKPPFSWEFTLKPDDKKASDLLDADINLIDDSGVVHGTFINKYDDKQPQDKMAKREEWGYLDVFTTAETGEQDFLDQMIVSLLSVLELGMWVKSKARRDNFSAGGLFSVFLCSVM